MDKDSETEPAAEQYTKSQLLRSDRYRHKRDLISALLVDGETYTLARVDVLIKNYGEKKV